MLAVIVTTLVGAVTALVSIILHYTNKGDDVFGCRSETLQMAGNFNTNKYCTREMAACNFLPKYLSNGDKGSAALGCAEAVSLQHARRTHRSQTLGYRQMAADCSDFAGAACSQHLRGASMAAEEDTTNANGRS